METDKTKLTSFKAERFKMYLYVYMYILEIKKYIYYIKYVLRFMYT